MEFACSPGANDGPYLFLTPNTTDYDRKIISIKNYEALDPVVYELYELEKAGYNWDQLHFVLFADGDYNVKRSYYDFDNTISFTSTPQNTIKKKYFHCKWLPIFSDWGGNYLGLDLDPDTEGIKGQVINFGRDEEDMFVFASNLEAFFDLILYHININNGETLKNSSHLHDTLKELLFKA
jgi:cell wall assembly regulator SMI1